jgi:hypothetical protein
MTIPRASAGRMETSPSRTRVATTRHSAPAQSGFEISCGSHTQTNAGARDIQT